MTYSISAPRLLERAANIQNGGSLTALPIIETQAGDVSAYIPTNVISITDGQIFPRDRAVQLRYPSGGKPGISGIPCRRQRADQGDEEGCRYACWRTRSSVELQAFSQFGLTDADTKKRLEQGARIVEVLKQPQNSPIPVEKQVIIIYAVVSGALPRYSGKSRSASSRRSCSPSLTGVYGDIPESTSAPPASWRTTLRKS